jgi:putative transposase
MSRKRRIAIGGQLYHVLNRAAGNRRLFETPDDYRAFEDVLREAHEKNAMRILAYCLMPNHWHFLLWPRGDGDLQRFVQWLTATHARRWNRARQDTGRGAVYQSRFKSVPVNSESQFLRVWRYVERNALRANLVSRAEEWKWGSLWQRCRNCELLSTGPVALPTNWIELVNEPQTEAELQHLREHIETETPVGDGKCSARTRGRPRVYATYK